MVSGGRARPRKKALAVRKIAFAAELGILPLQLADPGSIRAGQPASLAGVDLGLLHPAAQRVTVDTQLLADAPARRRDAARLLLDVENQADRPLPQLIWILPWCWHDSILWLIRSLHETRSDSTLGNDLSAEPGLVQGRLELEWSPEQIAVMLRRRFTDRPETRVCHETIHLALYVQSCGELRDSMRAQIAAYEGQLADVRGERDAARAEAERIRQNLADAREELQQAKARAGAFEVGEGSQAKLSTPRGRRE